MINELVKQNAFQGHITLNIDGLFQKAGAPKDRFAERCRDGWQGTPLTPFGDQSFHAEHIAELKLTAGVLGTDPVRATVLPPTTIDGEMVVTNRLPLKFFNLVPCPECGKKALTPGHILNGSLPKKSTIAMMDKLCGRPPKSTPVDPLLSNLGDYPEEEQKAIMGEEHFDKVELPKAILVVGSALQNIGITSLQVKASLNDLPLAVLDIHPPSQWNIIKEPELIFKAPVRPTLEAAVEHLAKMRAAK
ncbi:hypothetical protein L0F63_000684 [Massospora cicadina]|nr:hypothetical protein L0F63_000684 [Massospora cicadina]